MDMDVLASTSAASHPAQATGQKKKWTLIHELKSVHVIKVCLYMLPGRAESPCDLESLLKTHVLPGPCSRVPMPSVPDPGKNICYV